MAKRFTDSEKWEDVFFTELSNDNKVIWFYLLDHCDNAGIIKINIRNINYFCSTNITVENLFSTFKNRLTQITEDTGIINKFCTFQYGPDFLTSNNKAVIAAINKLLSYGIVTRTKENTYTLSIGYQYPTDTPKEKEKVKEQIKEQVKDQIEEQEWNNLKDKIRENGWNSLSTKEAARYHQLKPIYN